MHGHEFGETSELGPDQATDSSIIRTPIAEYHAKILCDTMSANDTERETTNDEGDSAQGTPEL